MRSASNWGIGVAVRHEHTIKRTPPTRLTGTAAFGVLVTASGAGALTGFLNDGLVLGAVLAALLIRRNIAWILIPLPPLVFVVAAALASAHRGVTALGTTTIRAFPMLLAATLLAGAIAAVRILVDRRPRNDI